MNYAIATYLTFLILMVVIIVVVGKRFYTNGRVFIISLFNGNVSLADQVNKLLLVAYYLFNIGYAFLMLRLWPRVDGLERACSSLALNMGRLILILAFTHYCNMLAIYLFSRSKSISINNKTSLL